MFQTRRHKAAEFSGEGGSIGGIAPGPTNFTMTRDNNDLGVTGTWPL